MTSGRLPGRRRYLAAALACTTALLLTITTQAEDDPCSRVRGWIERELERRSDPSLAIAVARDGRMLCEAAFGWADRERRVPATPHTRYSVASVSKPITATALLLLAERGAIDLDAPINQYLGDAPLMVRAGDSDAATVRRVAQHTAGLPLHHHFFVEGVRTPPPMEETIARYGDLVFPPGQRYQYSNLGYGVLDHLISRVSGRSYGDFLREALFEPLGMHRTSIGIPPAERGDFAVRYASTGEPLPYYEFDHAGGSAVFSSAHDLARFGLLHAGRPLAGGGPLLSRGSLQQMQIPTPESQHAYALGWQTRIRSSGHRSVGHTGGMPGVSTALTLVPELRLVVVALANTSTSLPHDATERMLGQLLPWRVATTAAVVETAVSTRTSTRRTARDLAGHWRGTVRIDGALVPLALRIDAGGAVHVRLNEEDERRLTGATFHDGGVQGIVIDHPFASSDAGSRRRTLRLDLMMHDAVLTGAITVAAPSDPEIGFALSHWVELRRTSGSI